MRVCSLCQTQYEDHVEICFVDGANLGLVPVQAEVAEVVEEEAAEPSRSIAWVWVAALCSGIGFSILIGVGFVMAQPAEAPIPTVEPPARPVPAPPALVFKSVPSGAQVYERDQLLGTTPLTLQHGEGNVLPRQFVLRLEGYENQHYSLAEASGTHQISLAAIVPDPAPVLPVRPRPAPRPRRESVESTPISPRQTPTRTPVTPRPVAPTPVPVPPAQPEPTEPAPAIKPMSDFKDPFK